MTEIKNSINTAQPRDQRVEKRRTAGNYVDVAEGETAREPLRRDKERDVEAIRAALIEGEQSGISDRTPEEIFAAARERLSGWQTIDSRRRQRTTWIAYISTAC